MTQKKTSPGPAATGAQVIRDAVSFQAPLEAARKRCTATLTGIVTKVSGSEAEIHAAMSEFRALERFDQVLRAHAAAATFQDLPAVRSWGRRLPGFHQLHVGPFRGVFLIGQDPRQVVALLFSRKPHDTVARLSELAGPYSHADQAKETPE